MTGADWGVAFGLGLASSLHCAQMCGPLVIAAGASGGGAAGHFAYNFGRIATYSLLGMAAGEAGGGVAVMAALPGLERWVALASGLLLVVAGVWMLGLIPKRQLIQIEQSPATRRLLRWTAPLLLKPGVFNRFRLGLLLGLLPCGMVWAALLKAASAGNALDGGATMLGFGAGTAGALLSIGLFAAGIQRRFSRYGTRVAAIAMIAAGLFVAWRGTISLPASGTGVPACHGQQHT
jgi:sulfite exporter TauE/SafE